MKLQPKPYNRALTEGVRELGRPTTPDELRQRGVRRLRSVGMAEVARLIEIAVNRTLMERTIGVEPAEMGRLVTQAQTTMAELLAGQEAIEASRDALGASRRELQQELADLRAEHPATPRPDRRAHDEALFERTLRAELADMLGERAARAVTMRATRALRAARAEAPDERDQEIERLERRVGKLLGSLENAEGALARISRLKDADLGVASLYRVVQGLGPQEPAYEAKQRMMTSLFEANLRLQKGA
jgi:hypothetical protein